MKQVRMISTLIVMKWWPIQSAWTVQWLVHDYEDYLPVNNLQTHPDFFIE